MDPLGPSAVPAAVVSATLEDVRRLTSAGMIVTPPGVW
jgi:hypothetical protein